MFFTSHEYVVGVATFFWCVSLVALNACDDEWLVAIKNIQEKKKDINKGGKKWEEKIINPING